jgi:hypothetical protein
MKRTSVRTFTSADVDLLYACLDSIDIEDIAHHLSGMPRYNAALPFEYTVAQHSLLVAEILPDEHKLWGLLHDATEAYLGDVVSPLKRLLSTFDSVADPVFEEINSILVNLSSTATATRGALERISAKLEAQREVFLGYRDIERMLMTRISERFLLGMPRPDVVKKADTAVMAAEMVRFGWFDLAEQLPEPPAKVSIYRRPPHDIRAEFLQRFEQYGGKC